MCCVQCSIFVQVCPSHQLGDSCCVHAAGRAACEIKYKFSHHFSSFFNHTVWLSNRTKIPIESGSSADKRFRTDLKIFNKNCIIYVSQADVQSSKRSRVDLEPSLFFTKEFNQSEACSHILRWGHFEHPSACPWALNTAARQDRTHQLRTEPRA